MGELHVDGQTDVASVPSDGGQAAQRFQRLVGLFLFHLEAVVVFLRFFRGFQDEHALVAVQDGGGVAFHSQKGLVKPHDGGDAHGAGENGCVGNGGTYFRGKTVNQAGIHGGRVGRGQVVGHQNLVFSVSSSSSGGSVLRRLLMTRCMTSSMSAVLARR